MPAPGSVPGSVASPRSRRAPTGSCACGHQTGRRWPGYPSHSVGVELVLADAVLGEVPPASVSCRAPETRAGA